MLAGAIATWVYSELAYVIGSSRFTDDARDTYMARRGVCRDFAHLTVAFLRSRSIPARVASVYAPGLRPMDFHLVAEAYYNGRWNVFDSTRLSSTDTLLRIATGRDAADTAFLSTLKGSLSLKKLTVNAELLEEAAA
jgi:transglutaminase-like putative cysteine protease